jgi:hypothetical protein
MQRKTLRPWIAPPTTIGPEWSEEKRRSERLKERRRSERLKKTPASTMQRRKKRRGDVMSKRLSGSYEMGKR